MLLPLPDVALVVALTAAVALAATGLGLLVLRLGRGWSLAGQLHVVVLALVASVVGGTVVVARAMFLSAHDLAVTLWVAGVSGLVALLAAGLLGRSFMRAAHRLLASARAVGSGATVTVEASRTSELDALARELAATSERLAQARTEVQRVETSRRELVAWVSHDLRTPLASVRAMAEALEDGLVDDPDRYHRGIRTQVDRLSGLVDDLFELSRLQAGQLPLQLGPTSVYDLISDVVADVAPRADERGVSVVVRGDLDRTLVVDHRQLTRALENLLSNALRFSPRGSEVGLSVRDRPTTTEIAVTDQGPGIAADDLARVFEAGWRADAARSAAGPDQQGGDPGGAGLGLAIVRSIVEAHGGSVTAHGTTSGTRFVLALPEPGPGIAP
ncbi:HAMP domain-containing sensor histidine kinase [Microlunatus spumicola]|uniref:histidine kinase n=1 Tax=Microlunatus spumicola TaxID=81499 RepID=A0ABP6Y4D6_9ACTN